MFAYCMVDRSVSEEQRCRTLSHRTGADVPRVQPVGTLMTIAMFCLAGRTRGDRRGRGS